MRLFLDLDTRSFIESAQFQRAVSSLVLKRRDHLPVDVQFLRSGAVVELVTGATGKLGLKADKDFNGSFAASDLEWTKSGTGDATTYRFDLNLNTVQINALFAGVPTPSSVALMLEIEWAEGDLRTSSNTLAVTLENDIVRGDEGVAEEGSPAYPLPGALELIARKGQNSGYAGLDGSGKVPVAQLPHISASLYETPNRFTADHTGWKVGDIIRQSGDSSPASLQIEVTNSVPGGAQEVVEITGIDVPDGATAGFQLYSNFGSSSWMDQSGPLSAADYATAIKNFLDGDCSWLGSAAISGAVVTFTFNSFGSASPSVAGDYAGLSVVTPGVDQLPFGFYGDFYDQSSNYYSAYAEVYGPMPAEGFAQEIANSLTNNIPFLNVAVNGTLVSATYNFLGQLPSQPNFYDPSGNGQLWQSSLTDGVDGVPPGTFLVSDISALGNAGGYKGIGDTVDFLSGYGAPSNSVGSLGNGYVDLNNGDFYHRSDSGWFFVLNIKGPQGSQGPQGQQGPTGPQGPSGVSGLSKAFTSSDIIVDGTGFDKIWPISCYGSGAGTYLFTGVVRVHQATIATGRHVRIKSLANNSAPAMGILTYVKFTDSGGVSTPGAAVTVPVYHTGGGDWDMGPNATLDNCYAVVVHWTLTCKFNTSPSLAFEIYGGTSGNPLVVKAGSGSTLFKLG